jgi:hypothetical protein
MAQLSVLILKYLSLVGLVVHDVLEVRLRCLQLVDLYLKIYRQLVTVSDYSHVLQQVLGGHDRWHSSVLLVQSLVLVYQLVPLRLHLLNLIMVLGEGTVKLGLEQN